MPFDYNATLAAYKGLAGKTDPKSLRDRRNYASLLHANRPKPAGAPAQPVNIGAGTTPPPTGMPAGAPPATSEGSYTDIGAGTAAPQLIPEDVWKQALAGLSGNGQWAQGVRLPTQQELSDIYAKNYNQQLQDLSYGVQAKQQQAQKSREQVLADRGISMDSQAYRNDQQAMADTRASEDAQLRAQARAFAQQQADSEFNRALQTSGLEMDKARLEQDLKYRGIEALSPLITSQAQLSQSAYQFASGQKLSREQFYAGLEQSDRQFYASLSQEDRHFADNLAETIAARSQNAAQFKKTYGLQLKQFKAANDQFKKQFLHQVQQDKVMTQLEKEKLAELIRSNKATEAIQMLAAKKAGSGQNPDDAYNLIIARNQAMIDSLVQNGMSQEDAVRVVAGYGEKGPGGVSYGVG